jgi:hypothetical protein
MSECRTCYYYAWKTDIKGQCRRTPPVSDYTWHHVYADQWCGEWVDKEQAESRQAQADIYNSQSAE